MASSQGFLPPYTDTGRTALVPDMPMDEAQRKKLSASIRRWGKTGS